MSSNLKAILEAYKNANKSFRGEFDGETWKIWWQGGDYPDYQGLTPEHLRQLLSGSLRMLADEKKRVATKLTEEADAIFAVIN